MKNNHLGVIYIGLILSIIVLGVINKSNLGLAQNQELIITSNISNHFIEVGEEVDAIESNSSIKIPLPSQEWNITDIDLTFNNIKLERETIPIEENTTIGFYTLGKETRGLGVQIKIIEPTLIYGVEIYGVTTSDDLAELVQVQINGYDDGGLNPDTPNDIVYGSTQLNMTRTIGWYTQMFPTPINLTAGNYYLILNYTGPGLVQSDNIYWFYNDVSPLYPELHISQYIRNIIWYWTKGVDNSPFLYRVIQRTNRTYFPEDIAMTAEINEQLYPVLNGVSIGQGNLSVSGINFCPSRDILHININNNNSIGLIFNLDYHITMKHLLKSQGMLTMQVNQPNNFTLYPEISGDFYNYSVRFEYPFNWYNIKVYRDDIDISSSILYGSGYIIIENGTITEESEWEITANSPNIVLELDVPKVNFEPSQTLRFSVIAPAIQGNYTFVLEDSLHFELERKKISVINEETTYNYTLSSNPNEGEYLAYVFWNNLTAAGVKTQTFLVNIDLFPIIVMTTLIIIAISSVSGFTTYKIVKKVKKEREIYRKSIFNKYMDVVNLEYIIIVDKSSGINVFDQMLAGKKIDPTLISGFLDAIRSFGIDLTGSDTQSQTIKLEYQQSKILMAEFKNFRLTLIMKENPSQDFLESIKLLSYDIEEQYGKQLANFDGEIGQFEGIKALIEQRLPLSLIYPLKVVQKKEIKLNSDERDMINKALNLMKGKESNYFFVSSLLSERKGFQTKDAETILNLIEKNIFQPMMSY